MARSAPRNSAARAPAPPPVTERVRLLLSEIIPNPRNDRVHPTRQIEMLKASIERFGQPRPVLVRKANRMLIGGHGIHQAMVELQLRDIDCLLWDVGQDVADQYLVADNRFSELSDSDPERTRDLLSGISENDFPALGFLPEEIEALFDNSAPISVYEVDTGPVADTFWISVRGPLEYQAVALRRLQELLGELDGVQVELGTTAG